MSIPTNFKVSDGTDLVNIFVEQASSANIATTNTTSITSVSGLAWNSKPIVTFTDTGNYLLSFTATNVSINYADTSYYCIALRALSNGSIYYYSLPILQGASNKFNNVPYNITGLFNTTAGEEYYIGLLNLGPDNGYTVTIRLNAMYLGNPQQ